jgi:hypothetical protein
LMPRPYDRARCMDLSTAGGLIEACSDTKEICRLCRLGKRPEHESKACCECNERKDGE